MARALLMEVVLIYHFHILFHISLKTYQFWYIFLHVNAL
jgi:hypothetical protein